MHRSPRSLQFYLVSAAVYAFLSYLAVQLAYDWELDRAGLHAQGFRPQTIFRNTYAVHFVSFTCWLAIALITGALVHRIQGTLASALDDSQRRADELALISDVGAAMSEPLAPVRLASDFLKLVRQRIVGNATVSVSSFDDSTTTLTTLAVEGPRASLSPLQQIDSKTIPSDVARHWLASHQPFFLADTSERVSLWQSMVGIWPHLADVRCYCLIPLISRDRPSGALTLTAEQPNSIDENQIRLMTSLGQYLAGALDSASLVANAEARADREARVNEELQQLNQAKSDFVSIVAHEFRTPLTGIQGFSEIIRDYELSLDEAREYAADIHADALRLTRMINTQLDLDRLQSGRVELPKEPVQINDLVASVVEITRARTTTHLLDLDLDPAIGPISGHADRLIQVITNLLTNAINYSSPGSEIKIATRKEGEQVHLYVSDQGVGIPAPALDRIFEPYTRIESGTGGRVSGTGLGLPIVRQIVTLHDGKVWAESQPGHGSVFHVSLPNGTT